MDDVLAGFKAGIYKRVAEYPFTFIPQSKLNDDTKMKTLVVTHHGPSILCQNKKYPLSAISGAFHSDLDERVSKADCWVYGHTHSNLDTSVKGCRLISNQPGYPSEDVDGFDSSKIVEL